MNIVYAGPTISHADVNEKLDCVCLGPVSHGDILKAVAQKPDAIGIIDGYFEGVPSVWHKEILYAMDQGIRVYGSASMGALRAAELHAFGMVGIGEVFESYRDGILEDDDEVAVVHGPEETGFLSASVPMVNIRSTLTNACEHAIIDTNQKEILLSLAKDTFYKQRGWNRLLSDFQVIAKNNTAGEELGLWLEENTVDQKRLDAIQMLERMKVPSAQEIRGLQPGFHFEWTSVWDDAFRDRNQVQIDDRQLSADDQIVIDTLRLHPEEYQRYCDKAMLSRLCREHVEMPVSDEQLKSSLNQLRARHKLDLRSQLLNYMQENKLNEESLTVLLTDASRVDQVWQSMIDIDVDIIDQLRIDGQYIKLLGSFKRE